MKILLMGGLGNQLFQMTSSHLLNSCEKVTYHSYLNSEQKMNFNALIQGFPRAKLHFEEEKFEPNAIQKRITNLSIRLSSYSGERFFMKIQRKMLEKVNDLFVDHGHKTKICSGAIVSSVQEVRPNMRIVGYLQGKEILETLPCKCGFLTSLLKFLNTPISTDQEIGNIAIHIRLGDYEGNKKFRRVTQDYYGGALRYLSSRTTISNLDVYSNDEVKALKLVGQFSSVKVKLPTRPENLAIDVLRSMTAHQYFVISNSTLSWWAAYSCMNKDKVVVAPNSWFEKEIEGKLENIYPKNWILI